MAQRRLPAGRRPATEIVERSTWFNALTPDDQGRVKEVAADAVKAALFSLLCVLDGARAIEDGVSAGSLELRHVKDGKETLLASSSLGENRTPLHELL